MSQQSKSELTTSTAEGKPLKKRSSDTEELSKDFKKPRKSLKQLTFETKPSTEVIKRSHKDHSTLTTSCPTTITDAIARIEATLEQIIGRQDTARASIERLLEIFTREVQELSSDDDVPPPASKGR